MLFQFSVCYVVLYFGFTFFINNVEIIIKLLYIYFIFLLRQFLFGNSYYILYYNLLALLLYVIIFIWFIYKQLSSFYI